MSKRELTPLEVSRLLKRPTLGRHRVSDNLYLQVRGQNTGSWLFRYMIDGKPHHLGLGRVSRRTLAEARARAEAYGQQLEDDIDPLAAKREQATARKIEAAKNVTFFECARQYIAAHAPSWKSAKHLEQWHNTFEGGARRGRALTTAINGLPVGSIDTALALKVLEPIWRKIPETATRCRQRCEQIIDFATASHLRSGDNPFAWRHLKHLLADPAELKKRKQAEKGRRSFPALPYAELPGFMAELRAMDTVVARALEFTILVAGRTDECLSAPWSEFDLSTKVWTIPAERMKRDRPHRVPLQGRALEIIAGLPVTDGHAFTSEGQPLHHMAMLKLLHSMRTGLTVHGFRSTFMDWCHERTAFPKTVIDMALAHSVDNKSEAAYRRGDLLDKRRPLMAAWDAHCMSPPGDAAADTATVTPIRRAS
jgi:integrase